MLLSLMAACSEDIMIAVTDEKPYETAIQTYGYLQHAGAPETKISVDVRESSASRDIFLGVTKTTADDISAKVEIVSDQTLVDHYNETNGTNYSLFPAGLVTLENEGTLKVVSWQTSSEPLKVTFTKNTELTSEGSSYLLPIRIKESTVEITQDKQILWYVVNIGKQVVRVPRDVINIACIQINGVNPLNGGNYKLKDSGEPFFDQVSLFAANINYDDQQQRAYITFNENLTPLLAQRDKYIKPLQDKGIKVTLSLLGNRAGVCFRNYSAEGVRDFAKEIKSVLDAYDLDGVMFDEEYMEYGANGLPGTNAYSWPLLCYEMKKIMPDKLITLYNYGVGSDFKTTIGGIPAGKLIDYAFIAADDSWSPYISAFEGMEKHQYGPYSAIIYDDYQAGNYGGARPYLSKLQDTTGQGYLKSVKEEYGVNFFYNMAANTSETNKKNTLKCLGPNSVDPVTLSIDYSDYFSEYSKVFYNEEVVREKDPYKKDY